MGQAAKSVSPSSTSYLCQSCRLDWVNRPSFDALNGLIRAWNELHVCLPAGKILAWLIDRITSWKTKAKSELSASNEPMARSKSTVIWFKFFSANMKRHHFLGN